LCSLVSAQFIHASIILARLRIVNTLFTASIYLGKIVARASIDNSCLGMYIKCMEEEIKKPNRNARALSKLGASKGGIARKSVLSPEERREIAQNAVRTRWARTKGIPIDEVGRQVSVILDQSSNSTNHKVSTIQQYPISLFPGTLQIGDISFPVHVLDNGRRVIAQREVVGALTGNKKGGLARYLTATNLIKYMMPEDIANKAVQFAIPGTQYIAHGYEATLLIEICDAYLRARADKVLAPQQVHLAERAEIIMRACAKVGIIALIDEVTGYDKYKKKHEYQVKLQAFISEDLQEWARMFPEEFWFELARLENIHYSPRSRPLRWGKYVIAFVYAAVDKDVTKELKRRIPNPHHGKICINY
jgi:hypothetical protein